MRKKGKYIKLKLPSVNPNVPDRVNAANVAFRDNDGISNVEIDPSCKELIMDFEQVLRDSRGGIKKSNNPRDPYSRRSHSSDGATYWIAYEAPVVHKRKIGRMPITNVSRPNYGFTRR
jgi:hypothetical protein